MSSYLLIAVVAWAMIGVLLAAVELGYRHGLHTPADEGIASHATAWEAALLGLLALLIGFTFAMAVTRFDHRRDLIVEEANAIESTAMLARYVDAPVRDRVEALLPPYLDARIRSYDAGIDMRRTMADYDLGKALQRQIWDQVVALMQAHPDSESAVAFMEAADDMVKAEVRRRAALENHVPLPVFIVLLLVAAAGMAATGYSCGLHRRRLPLGMILMPVLIVVVVVMVFDIDYPRAGLIRAGQGALTRLQHELGSARLDDHLRR
jgi:hypothetical protein